jgi:hypothetical protein
MVQQSVRRGRENQGFPPGFEPAWVIWTRSANSHTGPRPTAPHQRPDRWQHPTTRAHAPQIPLALKGASTDGNRKLAASGVTHRPLDNLVAV